MQSSTLSPKIHRIEHIADDVGDPAVQEHGGDERQSHGQAESVGDQIGHHTPIHE